MDLWVHGVILFSGTDPFSILIRNLTNSKYSHVGLLLKNKDGVCYCFESTGSTEEVLFEGKLPCVRLTEWSSVKNSYAGSIQVRYVVGKNDISISAFIYRYLGVQYEKHLSTLIRSLFRANKSQNGDSFFCSELVALALQEIGFLRSNGRNAENYLPKDFSASSEFLDLATDCRLSRHHKIRNSPSFCCL